MDIHPIGTLVSISHHRVGKPPRKFFGYVIKVEVTIDGIKYFVQFHPDQDARPYTPADLTDESDDLIDED